MQTLKRVLAGPWVPPELGKLPYLWAFSLTFMLWQYFFVPPRAIELAMFGVTAVLFLPLYLYSFWATGRAAILCIALTCLIGVIWIPYNSGAGTLFVFAAGMCGRLSPGRNAYRMLAAVLGLATVAGYLLSPIGKTFLLAPWIIGVAVGLGSIMESEQRAARRQLLRKQEEVEHIARIAERERISRDLHDLLGHSLSMIALKAELARKLARRDLAACEREIADIETNARQALAEVRAAVTGFRHSGLVQALASARASLLAADVILDERIERMDLAPAAEHVVALAVREAVTNIVRHAGASRCTLSLVQEQQDGQTHAVLRVLDDGKLRSTDGLQSGNGLAGMRERVAALGGRLSLQAGAGLALELHVPSGASA